MTAIFQSRPAPYPANFTSYEERRRKLTDWAKTHYVREFNLKGNLLDAACGEGFWADVFTDLGFTVEGFDREPEYIANGRVKYPRVRLELADVLEDLPYEPDSFDAIFLRGCPIFYAYRLTDMRRAIENLLPLLRYGGTLLLSAYSDGSGEKRPGIYGGGFWHHSHDKLLSAAEDVGVVTHTATVGNYFQVGMRG